MKIPSLFGRIFKRPKNRRDFLADQLGIFIAGAMFPWPLSAGVKVARAEVPKEKPAKHSGGLKRSAGKVKTEYPVHPFAQQFLGEELEYRVSFLWVKNAATGFIRFKKGPGKGYIGEYEARAGKLVGWLTSHKNLKMRSHMMVKNVNGKERFITKQFEYISQKGEKTSKSIHLMTYEKHRWYYRKFVDDKLVKERRRKIPNGKIYDDFVVASYNLRSGVYGKLDPGAKITIITIPYKGVDTFSFHMATKEEMKKQKKWISKHPKAKHMAVVKINKKIFGIKTGSALLLGDKDMVPIAATVEEVIHFGSVEAVLVKRKRAKPALPKTEPVEAPASSEDPTPDGVE
jgi:hypothetical protein